MIVPTPTRILIARDPIDFRKGIAGLAAVCEVHLGEEPLDGTLFVFANRRRDGLKMLVWTHGGFVLVYKKLEKGRFRWPPLKADRGTVRRISNINALDDIHHCDRAPRPGPRVRPGHLADLRKFAFWLVSGLAQAVGRTSPRPSLALQAPAAVPAAGGPRADHRSDDSTRSVAGGITTARRRIACPQVGHPNAWTSNTRHKSRAQGTHRDVEDGLRVSLRSGGASARGGGGGGLTRSRSFDRDASTPW